MEYKLKKISEYSEGALIDEIKRVSSIVKSDRLSMREFDKHARISSRTVLSKFGGWNNALQKAGLRIAKKGKFSDEEVFLEIKRIWDLLGRQPLLPELKEHSRISPSAIADHFGGTIKGYEKFKVWQEQQSRADGSPKNIIDDITPVKANIIEAATNKKRSRPKYGDLINFRGMQHAPLNELGVVFLFGMLAKELGYSVEAISATFPDCEAKRYDKQNGTWERIFIEFEYRSSTFQKHKHDYSQCDLLVCWEHDWQDCPIDVLSLEKIVKKAAES
jgi:hypothetical protein